MEGYLEAKDANFIHGSPNHPESQGAVEALNKTIQDYFQTITKMMRLMILNGLKIKIIWILNFYNQKRKHTITNKIPAEIFRKYGDPTISKEIVILAEQFRKRQ